MSDLSVKLPVGFNVNGEYTRNVSLLRSNAIAEEVFTRKLPEKPFTWIANVITIATDKIGEVEIGNHARTNYTKTGTVTIPQIVKEIPFADSNSLLLEIHRKVWLNLIQRQNMTCRQCAKTFVADIDLNRVELSEENKQKIEDTGEFTGLAVELDNPICFDAFIDEISKGSEAVANEFKQFKGIKFNLLKFKIPTLGIAIKNEQYASRNLEFWRKIGLDCLEGVLWAEKNPDGSIKVMEEFPLIKLTAMGLKFYNFFDASDLGKIRNTLREELPTMPFAYEDDCVCDMQRKIPYTMEATNFFSE